MVKPLHIASESVGFLISGRCVRTASVDAKLDNYVGGGRGTILSRVLRAKDSRGGGGGGVNFSF